MSQRHDPEQWLRPDLLRLSAYHVPPADGLIKLDAMENPHTWPGELLEDWLAVLREVPVNRYPDAGATALKTALRAWLGLHDDGPALMLGNGSDELIQILALALAGEEHDAHGQVGVTRSLLAPEPSFVMYRMIAHYTRMNYVGVPLDENFELQPEAMLEAIAEFQPALIFLAYPNNPTGNLWDRQVLRDILEAAPGLVVIDEAYAPFAGATWMQELAYHRNLMVMRTLSKLGLAGLRLGVLVGDPGWIEQLDKLRLPYNINSLTQASALFALEHRKELDRQAEGIRARRDALEAELAGLPGVTVWPSSANFLLFRVPAGSARAIHAALREAGVLIKCLDGAGPLLDDCLRVTVGLEEENAAFIKALRAAL